MAKLFFASLVTLSLLTAMVAGVVIAAFVAAGSLDVGLALVLVLVINAVIFFISPWLTDLMLKWVNKVVYLDDTTLAQVIQLVAQARRNKAQIERVADRLARLFLPLVLTLAAGTFVAGLELGSRRKARPWITRG